MKFIDFLNESKTSIKDVISSVDVYVTQNYDEYSIHVGFNTSDDVKFKTDDWKDFLNDLLNDKHLYDLLSEVNDNDEEHPGCQFSFNDINDEDLKEIYLAVSAKFDIEHHSKSCEKIIKKLFGDE